MSFLTIIPLPGVPDSAKTSADFLEGFFGSTESELDHSHPTSQNPLLSKLSQGGKNNLSPSVLKKRIEGLQEDDSNASKK